MHTFLASYGEILHLIAEFVILTVEIIGIFIVVFGSGKALYHYVRKLFDKSATSTNLVISLGRNLALALEFMMGAEILKTVILGEIMDLLALGIVVVLRAALAILIHWEITTEEKEEEAHAIARERALAQEQKNENENSEQYM